MYLLIFYIILITFFCINRQRLLKERLYKHILYIIIYVRLYMDFLSGYNNEKILLRVFFYNVLFQYSSFKRKIISLVKR